MMRAAAVPSLLAIVSLAWPAAGHADTVLTGLAGQAYYRIVVPEAWNGDLVFWNHGFSLSPPGPVTDLGPLAAVQRAQGYAIAASSYRLTGWAVFKTSEDLEALYQVFVEQVGVPQRVIVTGASLGGIVTAAAIEEADLGNVVGAYSLCGALAGSRNWDGGLDVRLGYDALCAEVPGAYIPGGAFGLPARLQMTTAQLAQAVHACFGILVPPPLRTAEQQQRLDAFLELTRLPENFVLTVMGFGTFGMRDLLEHHKLKSRLGVGNENVDYGDPAINAAIARVTAHPGAASRLHDNYTPTGQVGNTKIVSLHTDKDGLVIVENESEYAAVVPAANLTAAVAVESNPTHCGFTPAETLAGWESLRAWVAGAPQPTPAAIQGLCAVLAPSVGGPCRIDPGFVVPDMDGRIRPR